MTTANAPVEGARPEPSETFPFRAADGVNLYGEYYAAERPAGGAALIMHGYAEHCGRYREVAGVLCRAGLPVLAYDMRGHGRAQGQRGHVQSFTQYLNDLEAALDELGRRTDRAPVLLVAHSNGALVALRALTDAERCPERVRAAVLSSPFLGLKMPVSPVKSAVGRIASALLPTLSLPNQIKLEHLTRDQAKQSERRFDTLCHDVASARWFREATVAWDWVRTFASRVQVPTLWLVAGNDRLADAEKARDVHSRLRAPSAYHEFADMEHEVFNEIDRHLVFEHMESFVREQFPER